MTFMVKVGSKGSNLEAETSPMGEGPSGKLFTLLCLSHDVPSAMVPSASCSLSTILLPVSVPFLGLPSHCLQWHQSVPPLHHLPSISQRAQKSVMFPIAVLI